MAPSRDGVASLRLYLDLGDVFTKALAVQERSRRVRFPSVVAHTLLDEAPAADRLLLYSETPMQRPVGYDASRHSRLRSYPGGEKKLRAARDRGHPAAGARFAGRLAVLYGADRVTLGESCIEDNVDALVHKALLKTGRGCRDVEIVYVVDEGAKSASIESYASTARTVEMLRWTLERTDPEPMRLDVTGRVVDAAECVAAILPEELEPSVAGRVLVVDVGYTRTKLAVITPDGCEQQAQVPLGFSDCVRRVLRDGQDQGLIEDEFAVIWALERSKKSITVAGRRFDVAAMLRSATSAVVDELGHAIRRVVMDDFARHARPCRVAALVGGGAAGLGDELAARLSAIELGLETIWISPDPSHVLVDGACALERSR